MITDPCFRKCHLYRTFSLDPGCQMYIVTEGTALEQKGHPCEQSCLSPEGPATMHCGSGHAQEPISRPQPQKSQGPQGPGAPGPFSFEVQTKVEWKELQEQEQTEGPPHAKTLFCSGKGGLTGETCHVITSRILTDSSGIREKLHP